MAELEPIAAIVDRVARLYGLTEEDLMRPGSKSIVLIARGHAFYDVWMRLGSYAAVAQYFGRSNSSDVRVEIEKHIERMVEAGLVQ
jgi:hypothetical protein